MHVSERIARRYSDETLEEIAHEALRRIPPARPDGLWILEASVDGDPIAVATDGVTVWLCTVEESREWWPSLATDGHNRTSATDGHNRTSGRYHQ